MGEQPYLLLVRHVLEEQNTELKKYPDHLLLASAFGYCDNIYVSISIVQSYTGKHHKFVAIFSSIAWYYGDDFIIPRVYRLL